MRMLIYRIAKLCVILKLERTLNTYKYIIIGGTSKAGTTSLFNYLSGHPEVCPAKSKEVRFFLDPDYPLKRIHGFEEGINKYEAFFHHCKDSKIRLEATPDYLHSPGTPRRIKESLSDVKFIFLLRSPTDRLLSWYRYAIQNSLISKSMTFDDYVNWQFAPDGQHNREQWQMALEQGMYYEHLMQYYECFEKERILVVLFEQLRRDPLMAMKSICRFAGIGDDYYTAFKFKIYNPTYNLRSPLTHKLYRDISFFLRRALFKNDRARNIFRRIRLSLEPLYLRINAVPITDIEINEKTKTFLAGYYQKDIENLETLLGIRTGWVKV